MREASPSTWVLWIHASSLFRFETSIRYILDDLRVKGRDEPKANIFQLLQRWLLNRTADNKWILILDGADNTGFLLESPFPATSDAQKTGQCPKRRIDYLPCCPHRSILVTTRSANAASPVVDQKNTIWVGPMDDSSAISLLQSRLGSEGGREDLAALVRNLGNLPLALTQAASFI